MTQRPCDYVTQQNSEPIYLPFFQSGMVTCKRLVIGFWSKYNNRPPLPKSNIRLPKPSLIYWLLQIFDSRSNSQKCVIHIFSINFTTSFTNISVNSNPDRCLYLVLKTSHVVLTNDFFSQQRELDANKHEAPLIWKLILTSGWDLAWHHWIYDTKEI